MNKVMGTVSLVCFISGIACLLAETQIELWLPLFLYAIYFKLPYPRD